MEPDVLGEGYESLRLTFEDDAEGEVVATLVRRTVPGRKAVLYVHGFVDYFFQRHLADFYVERGYSFYALDLRKYGRSLLPHQTPNFARSMSDYFPEIDEAVRMIREDNDVLLLNGHSTGGLITALWADRVRGEGLIDGLFLNSPFLQLNVPPAVRVLVGPLVRAAARVRPTGVFPTGLSESYVRSIHRDHDGEWDFDLAWKPAKGFPVRLGWLSAIMQAHRQAHSGLAIDVPVLVMASTRSARGRGADVTGADAVLNADDIARWSTRLGPHVTCVRIDGGLHDLTLSAPPARERFFAELDRWMTAYLPEETAPRAVPEPTAKVSLAAASDAGAVDAGAARSGAEASGAGAAASSTSASSTEASRAEASGVEAPGAEAPDTAQGASREPAGETAGEGSGAAASQYATGTRPDMRGDV